MEIVQKTAKDMPTRQLLKALRASCSSFFDDEQAHEKFEIFIGKVTATGGFQYGVFATRQQIRQVLETRPHIPNKAESKLIRRLQSETGQTVEWLRAHPKYGQMLVDAQYPNRQEIPAEQAKIKMKYLGSLFGKLYKVI